jgi:anti-sigma-K factor RskA|tara:strand:+ start:1705 stop:2568 length:864 start_codon:yes stop_codon:yes gene_type:complete
MTEPSPTKDPFSGLAGLYALGALNADERNDFETHIETCQNCVDEVMTLLPVSHALTRAVPYHTPSVQLRNRVVQSLTGVTSDDHSDRSKSKPHAVQSNSSQTKNRRFLFNLSAVIFMVAAGGLGWYASQQVNFARSLEENLDAANQRAILAETQTEAALLLVRESNQRADLFSSDDLIPMALTAQPAAPNAQGRVFWSNTTGIALTVTGLPPAPAGRAYHLWFVPAATPVSGGPLTLDSAGRITTNVQAPDEVVVPVPVAITLEPEGDRTNPTGEVYFLGRPTTNEN